MGWAREHQHVVFTHDLDFGTLLALTRATGPSVIQVRTQNVPPAHLEAVMVGAIRSYEWQLQEGALVTVDEARGKVRMLPISVGKERGFPHQEDYVGELRDARTSTTGPLPRSSSPFCQCCPASCAPR